MMDAFPDTVLGWFGLVGFFILAVAYSVERFRRGTGHALEEALRGHKETAEYLRNKVNLIERDLTDCKQWGGELKGRVSTLEQEVERLEKEKRELRGLVMGDEVPAALKEFGNQMHRSTLAAIEGLGEKILDGVRLIIHQDQGRMR